MAQTTEETQRFYRDHLKSVEKWIQDVGLTDINDITADMVNDYIIDLKNDGKSQKTINNRLGIIKQLIKLRLLPYEYTKEQNIISDSGESFDILKDFYKDSNYKNPFKK